MIKIYNGDCIEGIKRIESESIDLVVTDPPYLMNYQSNRRVKSKQFKKIINDKDGHGLLRTYFKECHRVMKKNTAIYCFCSWHNVDFFKQELEKYFKIKNLIVWSKNNHGAGDLRGSYAPRHELIIFAHKGRSLLRGKRISDVISFSKMPGTKLLHPTEKPVGLLEIFIKNSSDEGDVVLDGFSGSGSTAIAAAKNKRGFIGYELDKEYYNKAVKRLNSYANKYY